jgi:hypothetical protein
MLRSRGVHILDNFPCFLTTAHAHADLEAVHDAFVASVDEMQEAGFLPRGTTATAADLPTAGTVTSSRDDDVADPPSEALPADARSGVDKHDRLAWFVPDADGPAGWRRLPQSMA